MKKKKKQKQGVMINTEQLHLVDVRLYKGKRVEIESEEKTPKAIVLEEKGIYTNVITGEVLPYFKRVPYTNCTIDNEEFGTKLFTKNKELLHQQGICYVETKDEFMRKIVEKEFIDSRDLEDEILYSDLYFIDRIGIIEKRINNGERKRKLIRLAQKDWENNCYFEKKLDSIDEGIAKVK